MIHFIINPYSILLFRYFGPDSGFRSPCHSVASPDPDLFPNYYNHYARPIVRKYVRRLFFLIILIIIMSLLTTSVSYLSPP